jgi:hypothetical protein
VLKVCSADLPPTEVGEIDPRPATERVYGDTVRWVEMEGSLMLPRAASWDNNLEAPRVAGREVKGDGVGLREVKSMLVTCCTPLDAIGRGILGAARGKPTQHGVEEMCVEDHLI